MLRLEKSKREISVSVRYKERTFNRSFLYALGLAFGIHVVAIFVFHIHSWMTSDVVLPATFVEADLITPIDNDELGVVTSLESERKGKNFLAFNPSNPRFPEMTMPTIAREMEYFKDERSADNQFVSIEDDWQYFVGKKSPIAPSLKIHTYGELSKIQLIDEGNTNRRLAEKEKSDSAIYAVQVERKTGHVFWFEPVVKPETRYLEELAEELLLNLAFQPNPKGFVSTGEIEIQLNSPFKDAL